MLSLAYLASFFFRIIDNEDDDDDDGDSASESLPPPPPSGLEAEPVNDSVIELSWKVPSYDAGPITSYTVVYTSFISASFANLTRLSLDDPTTSSVIRYLQCSIT